jgi:predicted GNAT family acetyltransferase
MKASTAASPTVGSNFMATLKTFAGIAEFISENEADLNKNYLVFRQFLALLAHINKGKIDGYKLFNIIENDTNQILCLQTKRQLLFFSIKKEISLEAYELLKSKIQTYIIAGIEILGETNLVLKIVKDCSAKFNVLKDRLICVCEKTKEIQPSEGNLQIPLPKDIEEIARMEMEYHKEEYGDKSNCEFQKTKELVIEKLHKQSLLLWKSKNEIVSIIHAKIEGDLFYIYHIYTKPSERKKGFGTNLLHTVTSKVIEKEKIKAGLVSQKNDNATNKIFNDIGFVPIYETFDIEIL